MARHFSDWLQAFQEIHSHTEASPRMLFWSGVVTIAGALRRKVWFDMGEFQWFPNFYVLFAGPSANGKSTAIDMGTKLLKRVPGIKFGADDTTRAAMAQAFAQARETVMLPDGEEMEMSALFFKASEFGNLFDTLDGKFTTFLIDMWDGKDGFKKETKGNGNDEIVNPCINIAAGLTPSGAAVLFDKMSLSGGFLGRCIVVYQAKKWKRVSYPALVRDKKTKVLQDMLAEDLMQMAEITGEFAITKEGLEWGDAFYNRTIDYLELGGNEGFAAGYLGRKQTHLHKLAMIIAVARGGMVLTREIMEEALRWLDEMEADMPKVFAKIGKDKLALVAQTIEELAEKQQSSLELYAQVHSLLPDYSEFERVLDGLVLSGKLVRVSGVGGRSEIRRR